MRVCVCVCVCIYIYNPHPRIPYTKPLDTMHSFNPGIGFSGPHFGPFPAHHEGIPLRINAPHSQQNINPIIIIIIVKSFERDNTPYDYYIRWLLLLLCTKKNINRILLFLS